MYLLYATLKIKKLKDAMEAKFIKEAAAAGFVNLKDTEQLAV